MDSFPGHRLLSRFRRPEADPSRPGFWQRPLQLGSHERPLRGWVLHVPQVLRALVRADEVWLVVLSAVLGVFTAFCVFAMTAIAQLMHRVLFALGPDERLSSMTHLVPWRALLIPTLGGVGMGIAWLALSRFWPKRSVDPIEANALYGGKMSLTDSLIVVGQTILSNGTGASVGLEAGYAQIGAAVASKIGQSFRLRRADLRVLVGAGAGAAIGAAFNAPLAGAFYGFELVIGTYSLANMAPVVVCAISAVSVMRILVPSEPTLDVLVPATIPPSAYLPILALGMICALGGITIMRGVTLAGDAFRRSGVPPWARPAIGGALVGVLGLISPHVLSSGHAALETGIGLSYSLPFVAMLLVLKSIASSVSIGSEFRGGLFFASLFLGALTGKLFAGCLALVTPAPVVPPVVFAIVGMSGFAVAIVGGPLTMAFLALESTGSLPMTIAVVAASVVSAVTVRRTFGYSFATWRFHLRGEAIRSAVDVGWMRNLTVGRMMRREVRSVRLDTPLAAFRRDVPLGSTTRVVAVDEANRYAGVVLVAEAHAADAKQAPTVGSLLRHESDMLLPHMTIKDAVALFEQAESDALAVVDGTQSRRVLGLLTEQHALRRYAEELERRRRELSGE